MKNNNNFFKRLIFIIIGISIVAFSTFYISTLTPTKISFEKKTIQENGIKIIGISKDLMIQSVTAKGIWANRGYDIYFKS